MLTSKTRTRHIDQKTLKTLNGLLKTEGKEVVVGEKLLMKNKEKKIEQKDFFLIKNRNKRKKKNIIINDNRI